MMLPDGLGNARLVGSGGLGDVYVATRESTGGDVAVKVLRRQGGPEAVLRRARRERDALASLRGHPHVVHLEDVLQTGDGQVLLVMEFMAGGPIDEYARRVGGTLDLEQTLLVGEQAASALSAAHGLGVVHRDIKSQNLLINSFGHIKVCDFGISQLGASDEFADRTDALSYRYASPEEIRGEDHVGPLTDVYSLGVTLAALMTGRFVTHETRTRLLDPESIPSISGGAIEGVERSLREVIVSCLSADLAERPDSESLTRQLAALGAELGPDRARHLVRAATAPSPAVTPSTGPPPTGPGPASPPASPPSPSPTSVARAASEAQNPAASQIRGAPARRQRSVLTTVLWALVGALTAAIVVLIVLVILERDADALGSGVPAAEVMSERESGSPEGLPLGSGFSG